MTRDAGRAGWRDSARRVISLGLLEEMCSRASSMGYEWSLEGVARGHAMVRYTSPELDSERRKSRSSRTVVYYMPSYNVPPEGALVVIEVVKVHGASGDWMKHYLDVFDGVLTKYVMAEDGSVDYSLG
jgi:hypothetical protein